jgi:hypothetical protein
MEYIIPCWSASTRTAIHNLVQHIFIFQRKWKMEILNLFIINPTMLCPYSIAYSSAVQHILRVCGTRNLIVLYTT